MRCDGRTDGDRLLRAINAAEAVHWLSGLAQALLAVVCLAGGYAAYGYALLLGNVPVNVYPILVQRLNRGRVYRLLRRGARTVSV